MSIQQVKRILQLNPDFSPGVRWKCGSCMCTILHSIKYYIMYELECNVWSYALKNTWMSDNTAPVHSGVKHYN